MADTRKTDEHDELFVSPENTPDEIVKEEVPINRDEFDNTTTEQIKNLEHGEDPETSDEIDTSVPLMESSNSEFTPLSGEDLEKAAKYMEEVEGMFASDGPEEPVEYPNPIMSEDPAEEVDGPAAVEIIGRPKCISVRYDEETGKNALVFHPGINRDDLLLFKEMNPDLFEGENKFEKLIIDGHFPEEGPENRRNTDECMKDVYLPKEVSEIIGSETRILEIAKGTTSSPDQRQFDDFNRTDLCLVFKNAIGISPNPDGSGVFANRSIGGARYEGDTDRPVSVADKTFQNSSIGALFLIQKGHDAVNLGNFSYGKATEADVAKNPNELNREGFFDKQIQNANHNEYVQQFISYSLGVSKKDKISERNECIKDIDEDMQKIREIMDRDNFDSAALKDASTLIDTVYTETLEDGTKTRLEFGSPETKDDKTPKTEGDDGPKNEGNNDYRRGRADFEKLYKSMKDHHERISENLNKTSKILEADLNNIKNLFEDGKSADLGLAIQVESSDKKNKKTVALWDDFDEIEKNRLDKDALDVIVNNRNVNIDSDYESEYKKFEEWKKKNPEEAKDPEKNYSGYKDYKNAENAYKAYHDVVGDKDKDGKLAKLNDNISKAEKKLENIDKLLEAFPSSFDQLRKLANKARKELGKNNNKQDSDGNVFDENKAYVALEEKIKNDQQLAEFTKSLISTRNQMQVYLENAKTEQKLAIDIASGSENLKLHSLDKEGKRDSDEYRDLQKKRDVINEAAGFKNTILGRYTPEYVDTASRVKSIWETMLVDSETEKSLKFLMGIDEKGKQKTPEELAKDLTNTKEVAGHLKKVQGFIERNEFLQEAEKEELLNLFKNMNQICGSVVHLSETIEANDIAKRDYETDPSKKSGIYLAMGENQNAGDGVGCGVNFYAVTNLDDPQHKEEKAMIEKEQANIVRKIAAKAAMKKAEREQIKNSKKKDPNVESILSWFCSIKADDSPSKIFNDFKTKWNNGTKKEKGILKDLFDGLAFNPDTGEILELAGIKVEDKILHASSTSRWGDLCYSGTNLQGVAFSESTPQRFMAFRRYAETEVKKYERTVEHLKKKLGYSGIDIDLDITEGLGAWQNKIKDNQRSLTSQFGKETDEAKKIALQNQLRDLNALDQVYGKWVAAKKLRDNYDTREKFEKLKNEGLVAIERKIREFAEVHANNKTKDFDTHQDVFSMKYDQLSNEEKQIWNDLHAQRNIILKFGNKAKLGKGCFSGNEKHVEGETQIFGVAAKGEYFGCHNSETMSFRKGQLLATDITDETLKKKYYQGSKIHWIKAKIRKENLKEAFKEAFKEFRYLSLEDALIQDIVELFKLALGITSFMKDFGEKHTRDLRMSIYKKILNDNNERTKLFVMLNNENNTAQFMRMLDDDNPNAIKNSILKLFGSKEYEKIMAWKDAADTDEKKSELFLNIINMTNKKWTSLQQRWNEKITLMAENGISNINGLGVDKNEIYLKLVETYEKLRATGGEKAARSNLNAALKNNNNLHTVLDGMQKAAKFKTATKV